MDQQSWIDLLLGPGGLLVFLLICIYGGIKQWFVFGWAYREKIKECEEWKALAKQGTKAAEAGIRTVEKVVGPAEEHVP